METIDVILLSALVGAFIGYWFRRFEVKQNEQLAYLRGESDTLNRIYGPWVRLYLAAHGRVARDAAARPPGGAG